MYSAIRILVLASIYIISLGEALPRNSLNNYPPIRPYFLEAADLDTLKLVQVLHRHGDRNRNAEASYPLDPHKDVQIGPKGKGQLTAIGKANAYELGRYLRARYDGFLSPVYCVDEVLAKASDRDRTIMTCQALLAGLFPPAHQDPEGNWNEKLKWQPIPVHVISSSLDNIILQNAACPKYNELSKEVKNSSIVHDFDKKHEKFYAYLSQHSGRNIQSAEEAYELLDILVVERAHGLRLPSWTDEPGFWITANEVQIANYARKEGYTLKSLQLRAGPLFTNFLTNMETKRNQTENPAFDLKHPLAKLQEFSGHDSTIYSFLNGLAIPDVGLPPYASAVIVELHKGQITASPQTDSYFVKVFYRNETNSPAYDLEIPRCGSPCSLDQFKQRYSHLIMSPEEWTQECSSVASATVN